MIIPTKFPLSPEIASERHHWRKTAFSFMELSKHTEPSACAIIWHLRKALYLYVDEDVTAKPIPSKSLKLRSLWLVFVVCFIVFISIILNVAHHSLLSEYTKMRCKDTNFLSYKHQNARKIIHIYDSLTLKYALFRFFSYKINRNQWYLPNLATIQQNSALNDISPQKSFLFIVPQSFSSLTLFTIRLFRTRPADIDAAKVIPLHHPCKPTS